MRTIITFLLFGLLNVTFAQNVGRFIDNNLVIKIKERAYLQSNINIADGKFGIPVLDNLNSELHLIRIESIGQHAKTRTFLLVFQNPLDFNKTINSYKNTGLFDFVEVNGIAESGGHKFEGEIIPTDPRFLTRQWGLYNLGTQTGIGAVTNDADVDMELAWDIQTGDPNMIIAVSDSGLKMNHPDIASRIWTNPNETLNGIDDDGNGLIDDVNGWDWSNNDNNPTDDHGHGTNVAGIIGAIPNNDILFTGANWNSKIMVLKSLGSDNSGTYAAMANSIYYGADNGAKILSMSIGGGLTPIIENAVIYANTNNMLIVACTMNFNNNTPYYPAAYSTTYPNVIAVGATNPNDSRTSPFFWSNTSGSNYGSHVNVVAPGNFIYGLDNVSNTAAGSYWGGTSQATPLVSAIASLVWAQNPSLTPNQVRTILETTAEDQVGNPTEDTAGFDVYMGHGRVNAHAALLATPLSIKEMTADQAQEFQMINPIQSASIELFSKGQFPGNYTLKVHSIDGKLLQSESVNIKSGSNTFSFNHPKGSYIVTLESKSYTKIFKILKS